MKRKHEHDSSNTALKQYLAKVNSLKYVYIGCLLLFFTAAVLYNQYSPKVYQISSTIGPVKDNRSSVLSSNTMFQGFGASNQGVNIEDEINSLSSFNLISTTVSKMNLETGYFTESNSFLKQTIEVYLNSPFLVTIDKSHVQPINSKFYISILSDSTYRLSVRNSDADLYNYIDNKVKNEGIILELDTICQFNKTILTSFFKFSLSLNKEAPVVKQDKKRLHYFVFYHQEELSKNILKQLNIKPLSLMASLIKIEFLGENIDKSITFLNNYITGFLEESLAKKNHIALNTMNFIDSQISEISDSLTKSESKLKNFRTLNQVTDLSFQGQRIYDQLEQIETDRTNLEVQSRYYTYVINYFKTNQDITGVVPPISANITDPIMNKLITDLFSLNTERSNILNDARGKNIFLGQVENQIKLQKQAIIENVTNNLNTVNLTLNELNYKAEKLTAEISNLPRTEMNMVNIQRKFNLNDAIYTFLLQKRSEAAIALASNFPEFEILEPAREITSEIIKPKILLNYLIAIFLAIMIPTLYLIIRDLLNDKISSIHDLELLLDSPAIGVIYSNPNKYELVVVEAPRSAIAESFRQLRSNLFHRFKADKSSLIMVTSGQPQDGKSFISFNLAASIASTGLKTIIIDADLRRPALHTKFGIENKLGLSNYITKTNTLNEIIHPTSVENLFFIPAGPILANSSELIESGALTKLIESLKEDYRYLIFDTSPVGLIADANFLMKYASQILLVSRNNYTNKTIFENVLSSLDSRRIENYDVVYNDLSLKNSPYSNYTSYYLKD
jgi:capsular exopolysaccharide synthesis family protein